MQLDPVSHGLRRQLGDRPAVEDLALDRPTLHHHPHVAVERVDARLQERLDRRRNDNALATALTHHREHLLHEERVAGGCNRDPLAQSRVQRHPCVEAVHELCALVRTERLEQERSRIHLSAAPTRTHVEKLGACDAQEEDRRVT